MKEKNKKKNIYLLFVGCLLACLVFGGFFYYIFYYSKENDKKLDKTSDYEHTLVEKKSFNGYVLDEIRGDRYIVKANNKFGLINDEGEVLVETKYLNTSRTFLNSDKENESVFTFYDEDKNIYDIYDRDGKLLVSVKNDIAVYYDSVYKTSYYYDYEAKCLMDMKKNCLYKGVDIASVMGNRVYNDYGVIYNLETKETIKGESYSKYDYYILVPLKDTVYVYDIRNDTFTIYEKLYESSNGYKLKKDNQEYNFIDGEFITSTEEKKGEFVFDYKSCNIGFKVYRGESLVSNDCYTSYEAIQGSQSYLLYLDSKSYVLSSDDLIYLDEFDVPTGEFIVSFKEDNEVFDHLGNKVENVCYQSLSYAYDDKYICDDSIHKYFVDKDFHKLSEDYDDITCYENGYCIVVKEHKNGLTYKDKVLFEPIYFNISIVDNYVVIRNPFGFDVYFIDEEKALQGLSIKDLTPLNRKGLYSSIDVHKVVKDYNLEDIEDIILENEEFFLKYAYLTLNNKGLEEYKEQVLRTFNMIVKNKEYLWEDYLLCGLSELRFEKKNVLKDGTIAGLYYDNEKLIEYSENTNRVIYHELAHFVDWSINSEVYSGIYEYDGKYIDDKEYTNLSFQEKKKVDFLVLDLSGLRNFIVEGGAEANMGIYSFHKVSTVYTNQTNVYHALSYIYGFDTINEIFFSKDSASKLFKLFNESGLTKDEIVRFGKAVDPYNKVSDDEEMFFAIDTLVDLYEKKYNKSWLDDKEFKIAISHTIKFREFNDTMTKRYSEYKQLDLDFHQMYMDILGQDFKKLRVIPGTYLIDDEGSYFNFAIYDGNKENVYLTVKYDFENDKVLDIIKVYDNEINN